jgi:hypothetical protein
MSVDTLQAAAALDPTRTRVAGAIKQASDRSGASFAYMVGAAKIESNLNPTAAAPTSSARGLYQFIEQTWLGTMKEAGAKFGYGQYAAAIDRQPSGRYTVSDPAMRAEILNLRRDPTVNSTMAGVLTRSNTIKLTNALDRQPTDGELYMAHFLGANGASRLITKAEDNPRVSAVAMFPRAAAANRSIFYDRSGSPRSVSQVYAELDGRYTMAAKSQAARSIMASYGTAAPQQVAAVSKAATVAPAAGSVLQAQMMPAQMVTVQLPSVDAAQPRGRSLYQGGDRNEPVSPAVRNLWGRNDATVTASSSDVAAAGAVQPKQNAARPLDLFSDRAGLFAG